MDLVVTLPQDRGGIIHLGEKATAYRYDDTPYWETKIKPVKLKNGERVFILTEKYIRGFFILKDQDWSMEKDWRDHFNISDPPTKKQISDNDLYYELHFIPESWKPIIKIYKKGFQGIRYRNFSFVNVYELLAYHKEDCWRDDYYYDMTTNWQFYKDKWNFYEDLGYLDEYKWFYSV